MALPISSIFQRRYFQRAFSNGETFDYASLDGQIADLVEGHNQSKARLEAISTSAGSLKYALVSINTITATASQTAFTVTTYDNTAGASFVLAWSGSSIIAQASITQTSTTVVTLPAQTVGTVVTIAIFAAGNGTSQLASTTAGQGAALIGINDAGAYLTATTVEGALQEIAANLASSSYLGGVLTISNYIKKDGSVAFTGDQSMGSHKITNLAAGTASSNDAARMADITSAALQATLGAYLSSTYLALSGGTMSGTVSMGTNKITNLAAGTAGSNDAARMVDLQALQGSWITSGTVAAARLGTMTGDSGAGGASGAVPAPAAGDAAALKFLKADGTWAAPGTLGTGYVCIEERQTSGTAGGSTSAGSWTKRSMNTTVVDSASNVVSLSSGVITLKAGTYRCHVAAPGYQCDLHRVRVRDTLNGTTLVAGSNCYAPTGAGLNHVTVSVGHGRFVAATNITIQVETYASGARAGDGLGLAVSTGESEIYARVVFERE